MRKMSKAKTELHEALAEQTRLHATIKEFRDKLDEANKWKTIAVHLMECLRALMPPGST